MSEHIALYRAWRPLTFSDVVGQEHVTRTLQNEISKKSAGHAFLFCGGRGTGKTSTARILSRALNCENSLDGNPCNECATCKGIIKGEIMDIVEIDAASNNGVDNIRDLRADAKFAAATAKYKIYIIDEVHMLSQGAFNALLKLLEEPPTGVVFILATTETHKVPLTILSRCQRFDFKRITLEDIAKRLLYIAYEEKIDLSEKAAYLIARAADGALRDALSILDQCRYAAEKVDENTVNSILGIAEKTFLYRVVRSVATDDVPRALSLLDEYIGEGKSPSKLIESLIDYFASLLRYNVSKTVFKDYSKDEMEEIALAAREMTKERMIYCIEVLTKAASSFKFVQAGRVLLDTAIIKMCMPSYAEGEGSLALRISELERKIESGSFSAEEMPFVDVKEDKMKINSSLKENEKKQAKKKLPDKLIGENAPEEFKALEEKWRDICRSTDNIMLLISLEHSRICEDSGSLVLIFDDADKVMIDILSQEETKNSLVKLIEEHTGKIFDIKLRLASYYEYADDSGIKKNDPISEINLEDGEISDENLEKKLSDEETDDEEYEMEEYEEDNEE